MPILKGFPASSAIGAGIKIAEKDYSLLTATPSTHTAGIVGFATKGPMNVPTLVTSLGDLHTVFGFPHPSSSDPYGIYAAEQFLMSSNNLWYVRAGDTNPASGTAADTASVQIPSAGGPVEIVGNDAGPFDFDDNTFLRWKLNGVPSSKILVVMAGDGKTVDDLVDELNGQLTPLDGVVFSKSSTNTLKVATTFSFGTAASLEFLSIQNALYGPDSVVGLGTGMTVATLTGTADRYATSGGGTAGTYDLSAFVVPPTLDVVIGGSDNVNIDNVIQTVVLAVASKTVSQIVTDINNQISNGDIPGGFVASASSNRLVLNTLHAGQDASLLVKATSTAAAAFGLAAATAVGTTPSAVSGGNPDVTYDAGLVSGSSADAGVNSFELTAESPGTAGNLTQVVVRNNVRTGTFSLDIYNDGVQVEHWAQIVKDPASRFYAETFIALVSKYVRVVDNTAVAALPLPGTYTLSGGTDGVPGDPSAQDDLLIGASSSSTGLQGLSDPERIDIDLVCVPGHSSTDVVQAMLALCQDQRQDCFAVVDPPFGMSPSEIVDWVNGTHPLNLTKLDNDFGALYWPWVKVRDTYNRIDVWVPPSGVVLAAMAASDNATFPWYAPAGEVRGVLPNVLELYDRASSDERDLMYGNGNCVNPITRFADSANFMIWGAKTMQRLPSALDRVNVRRGLLYIEKQVRRRVRRILFDPHDEALRQEFVRIASEVLDQVKRDRGVYDYFVKCDAELNTNDVVDRNELRAKIGVQPVKDAEFMFIEFSVHKIGDFTENADTF